MQIPLDFTPYQSDLRLKKENGKTLIFDPIRKKHLVLAPEELVRQLFLQYLIQDRSYSASRIRTEKGIRVHELYKRCDILIYDKTPSPFLLVECKAPAVKITQAAFEQIARYNLPLQVKYLVVTNGIQTYCCVMDYEQEKFRFLPEIPTEITI